MKLSRLGILLFALLLAPAVVHAQVDLTLVASRLDVTGTTEFDDDLGAVFEFEEGSGYGASVNVFWSPRFSSELAGYRLESDAALRLGGDIPFELGVEDVELTPITLALQWHFARDAFLSPYVGIGLAYVMIDDLTSDDFDDIGIGRVEVDDKAGFVANAGLGLRFTDRLGVVLDAKYIPLEAASRSVGEAEEVDLELNPLIVSAGVRLRF